MPALDARSGNPRGARLRHRTRRGPPDLPFRAGVNPERSRSGTRGEPRHGCPCCRRTTLPSRGRYDICPVCGWEDTGQGDADADADRGGPNRVTLTQARENFREFGASEERLLGLTRPPKGSELPDREH
ncbi:CPCC family cysteine-rich protein [Kitasatospora sp. NPDC057015]|uniref:CPCC family cysteine-rich protein n=1 Tax=Kitasatospora sp. NPDC057015 TaxID=3346001 RepID=UPI003633EE9E